MKNRTMNKLLILITLMLSGIQSFAETEWTDTFYRNGKYSVVVAILAIIFTGIIVYLIRLDSRISKMEKKSKAS